LPERRPAREAAEASHYDSISIRYHWITAASVLVLWGIAEVIDDFPRGTPRVTVRSLHILLGIFLALLLLGRIYWRLRHGRRLAHASAGVFGFAARAMHYILYLGLVATIGLGIANVWIRGDRFFGLFTVPSLAPGDRDLRHFVEELHENFANGLLILAGLHACAGLVHHFVLRDSVLRRMLPDRARRD
jgi:cytochrome b561